MKTRIISGLLICITGLVLFSFKQKDVEPTPEAVIEQGIVAQVDSFSFFVDKLRRQVIRNTGNPQKLQQLFLQTRLAYKKFEWAAEYFTPTITRFVNGPPVPEVEMNGQQVFEPEGLQVIEDVLFNKHTQIHKKDLLLQLGKLKANCNKYKLYYQNVELYNWQIFDAARLEIFRVLTLGITGFDDPLSLRSMQESAVSLTALQMALAAYKQQGNFDGMIQQFNAAIRYLQIHNNFNAFNRAAFITGYGNKLSISLYNLQQRLNIPEVKYNRLLNQEATTLFDEKAFNANAFGTDLNAVSPEKIALGKKLFSDPMLSGTGTRSCASCHQPNLAFTDGLVKNTVIDGKAALNRNTPTLLNAALQPSQFYDLRAGTLEEQIVDVMQNKQEMHGSVEKALALVKSNKTYVQLFAAAYSNKDEQGIDTLQLTNAIASYLRSLTLLNSRFDEYMRGNIKAMNGEEINGFNLFMGKAKCGTCHYMPLFNGTLPPKFLKTESEVIGVPASITGKKLDPDMGQFSIIPIRSFKHAFKTPTLRNISHTAPYMHNGVFATLTQVVDFYNKGGGAGMGLKVANQTLPATQLHLTAQERKELIAFMKTLDSNF